MADGFAPIIVPGAGGCARRKRTVVWFAGGGGSSEAIRRAMGAAPDAALNHWPVAIGAHMRHFPETEHHCSDAFEVKPHTVFPEDDIGFGWFSPDCTDFSVAKGKALRSERRRGLAWVVYDWGKVRRPDKIVVENVWEFTGWGPLYPEGHAKAGERIPERQGETFEEWKQAFLELGAQFEYRKLCSADYGGWTTRTRLYVVITFDGKPIRWPARTHAPRHLAASLGLKPWRGMCEKIDWSIACPSIFLTPEEIKANNKGLKRGHPGRLDCKRPLVPATLKRVARGIDRFVISAAEPFIAPITHQGSVRTHDVREPLKTVTCANRGEFAVVDPTLAHLTTFQQNIVGSSPAEPLRTVMAGAVRHGLVESSLAEAAFVAGLAHGEFGVRAGDRNKPLEEPLTTVAAGGGDKALVSGALVRTDMQSAAGRNGVRDPAEPLATVTSGGGLAVTSATLVGCGGRRGMSPPVDVWCPMPTITGKADACLATTIMVPYLVPRYGERPGQEPRCLDVTEPGPTIVPDGTGGSLVVAHLAQQNTRDVGARLYDPARTITGKGKLGLVAAHLQRQFGSTVGGRDLAEPIGTVMPGGGKGGAKANLVSALLTSYYATGVGSDCADPLRVATAKARHGLSTVFMEQATTGGMIGRGVADPLTTIIGRGNTQRLTTAFMEQAATGLVGHDMRQPSSTIVSKGCTQRLIEARLELEGGPVGRRAQVLAFLWAHFGEPTQAELLDPLATRDGRLKLGLVVLQGAVWMIVDIGLRMLVPRELAGAMGHGPEFDLEHDAYGRPISKTDQTHLIGNMVEVCAATALIEALHAEPDPLAQPEPERVAA